MMDEFSKYFEVNKETWNKKVTAHAKSSFYDIEGFLKGKTSLNSYELEEVGSVKNKKLLHLQCHFGQDTLSWSRLGAQCVGIDLSNEGIKLAKELAAKLKLDARFIESNVYDVSKKVSGTFDIVFTSYGVIGWLPDLKKWAQIIADKLVVGGFFYMIEFHPIVWMFNYHKTPPKLMYPYLNSGVIYEEYEGSYTENKATFVSKEYGWNHGLSEVINALIEAGLQIEFLHEFEKSPYNVFPEMEKTLDGMYILKKMKNLFPLVYSIKAVKK